MKSALLAFALVLQAIPSLAADEPDAVYAKFHRAIAAGDLDEMLRYATDAQRNEIAAMSPAQKAAQIKMLSALMPRAYELRSKSVNPGGQGARLIVSGQGPALVGGKPETLYGTIRMVMQGGDWKVGEVNWSNSQPPGLQAAPKPAPAQKAATGAVPARSAAPPVGSMGAAPERKLGTQKPPCVFKPVMTAEDLENCK